jgi:hypothetical protein
MRVRYSKLFVLGAMAAITTTASARSYGGMSADERLKLMLRCNAITEQLARAACYDDAATQALAVEPGAKGASGRQTAAPIARPNSPTAAAPAALAAETSFGADTMRPTDRAKEEAPASRKINGRLVSRDDNGTGYLVFNLDSGASWQMTEKSEFDLPATGDTITIRRTLLGGYLMDVGARSAVRVVRLR